MRIPTKALLLLLSILGFLGGVHAQENPALSRTGEMKTLVVAAESKSGAVIAIPPVQSVTVTPKSDKPIPSASAVDLKKWLGEQAALNGLESTDLRPWHIVMTYDQFDEDGDNVHSGVYEEYWAGPKKYKRIYKADNFNQTDYATDTGLYRQGDQAMPDRAQSQVRAEVIAPFSYAATLEGFHGRKVDRTFGGYKLQCVMVERDSSISDPTQYCFEPDSSILRYDRGFGWLQTVYNRIVPFQGRNLAQEVEVTDAGKAYLKLRVETIESISQVSDTDFIPPSAAAVPLGDRISGVNPRPARMSSPQWPKSLRSQHFTVTAEIVIGKDGHVVSAHGVSGPAEGYKACEEAVRKWVYAPYLLLDRPVEVETKVICSNN